MIKYFVKALLRISLLGSFIACYLISNAQNYAIGDTTIVTCGGWFYDDGLSGPMSDSTYTITLKSASGTAIALNFYEFTLAKSFTIELFDGCDTQASPMGYIGHSPVENVIPGTIVSTGPCLTLRQVVNYPDFPDPVGVNTGWKAQIACLPLMDKTEFRGVRLPIRRSIMGTKLSNIGVSDYDQDGDQDFIVRDSVYRNDTPTDTGIHFSERNNYFGDWNNASTVAADFDKDGDIDIFVSGWYNGVNSSASRSVLYEQLNRDDFKPINLGTFDGASEGKATILDFDGDGDQDIAYTGNTANGLVFRVYKNQGGMQFTQISFPAIKGARNGNLDWADVDNDTDLDLLISGVTDDAAVAGVRVGINNGSSFAVKNLETIHYLNLDAHFFDFDSDGDKDVYVGDGIQKIYTNDGSANFTPLPASVPFPFAPYSFSTFIPADYDNDGDEDALLTGLGTFKLYKNLGNAQFIEISVPGALPGQDNEAVWADFNADGLLDFYAQGLYFNRSALFLNRGNDVFEKSARTMGFAENSRCTAADFDNDGHPDVFCTGTVLPTISPRQCAIYSYCDNLDAVTKQPVFTPVAKIPGVELIDKPNWQWGDYDKDGYPDLLLHDAYNFSSDSKIKVYKNNGNNTFSEVLTTYGGGYYTSTAWVDFDGDNDLDIYMGRGISPEFYKNNGNGQFTFFQPFSPLMSEGIGYERSCKWLDLDHDGDQDLLDCWRGTLSAYLNDGTGKLTPDSLWAQAYDLKKVMADDFDADGNPDVFAFVQNKSFFHSNGISGLLLGKLPNGIPHVVSGDFNGDNLLDFISPRCSFNYYNFSDVGPFTVWLNQGNFLFQPDTIRLAHLFHKDSDFALIDYDKDGDTDIISTMDISDAPLVSIAQNLTNEARRLNIISPNWAEQLLVGSQTVIQWSGRRLHDNGETSVHLSYSTDGGLTYNFIAEAPTTENGGTYQWSVPNIHSDQCFIRIESMRNQLRDQSNFRFTITDVIGTEYLPSSTVILDIFPNPVSSVLYLSGQPSSSLGQITVADANGKIFFTHKAISLAKPYKIPVDKWPSGIYFVLWEVQNGHIVKSFVKK